LDLRDEFAMRAMESLLISPPNVIFGGSYNVINASHLSVPELADKAYAIADAMMTRRLSN
jgi:hypothetical protein